MNEGIRTRFETYEESGYNLDLDLVMALIGSVFVSQEKVAGWEKN